MQDSIVPPREQDARALKSAAQKAQLDPRVLGHARSEQGRYARVVERFTVLENKLSFRALCERVIGENTRYLILDLDRTTHRDRNLGELLGWEIAAYRVFGEQALHTLEPSLGRFFWNPREPWKFARYWREGIRTWAFPGLSYLLWGKLSAHVDVLERWAYRKFGPEPMQSVQRVPQTALLHKLSTLPESTLQMLARRVWRRLADDQVITREDLQWVRTRCPAIRIIITSASPKPMLDVAAEELGVDAVEYSSSIEHDAGFSTPYWVDRRFDLGPLTRIATPDEVHINSGHNKVERLLHHYPDLADPHVESVGISDTGYGEDHGWAQYLTVTVDINSSASFPPVVAFDAPLREIYSAKLLTQRELRSEGEAPVRASVWTRAQLEPLLATQLVDIERLARAYDETKRSLAAQLSSTRDAILRATKKVEQRVEHFNAAPADARSSALRSLRVALFGLEWAQRKKARAQAPVSKLRMQLVRALRESRAQLVAR